MKAAVIVLIVFLSIALYFSVGFIIANLRIPVTWRIARREHHSPEYTLTSVKFQYWFNATCWPIYTATSLIVQGFRAIPPLTTGIEQRLLRHDPEPELRKVSRW